jgi:hypothetical protein
MAAILRAQFTYRDQTGQSLEAHTQHWKDFTYQKGPVVVIHKGAAWGVPQVWAASAEEGKRVIRHAGSIAGVNPDAEGEWVVRQVSAPRYGRTGTMVVKPLLGGFRSVTKRDGPGGMPLVASPDP